MKTRRRPEIFPMPLRRINVFQGMSLTSCHSTTRSYSAPVAEPVPQEIIQVRNRVNLLDGGIDVIFHAAVAEGVAVQKDIAGPPVAVAGLAHRADVHHGF